MKLLKSILLSISVILAITSCKDERSEKGDIYFKNGQYEKAIEAYTEYLRLEPTHLKSLYNRGRAYEEVGQYTEALKDFNSVLKEDPQNVNALLSVTADYYYRQQDYENTIFYAEKVLAIDESAMAHTLKGKGFQKLGKLKEAMASYNAAISVDKEFADAYVSRGSLKVYLNQTNRACADFRMAANLGVDNAKDLVKKYCN